MSVLARKSLDSWERMSAAEAARSTVGEANLLSLNHDRFINRLPNRGVQQHTFSMVRQQITAPDLRPQVCVDLVEVATAQRLFTVPPARHDRCKLLCRLGSAVQIPRGRGITSVRMFGMIASMPLVFCSIGHTKVQPQRTCQPCGLNETS